MNQPITTIQATPPLEVTQIRDTVIIGINEPLGFWARLTTSAEVSAGGYLRKAWAWIEVMEAPGGTFVDHPSGRTGNTASAPAFERGTDTAITGDVVWLDPASSSAFGSENDYPFEYAFSLEQPATGSSFTATDGIASTTTELNLPPGTAIDNGDGTITLREADASHGGTVSNTDQYLGSGNKTADGLAVGDGSTEAASDPLFLWNSPNSLALTSRDLTGSDLILASDKKVSAGIHEITGGPGSPAAIAFSGSILDFTVSADFLSMLLDTGYGLKVYRNTNTVSAPSAIDDTIIHAGEIWAYQYSVRGANQAGRLQGSTGTGGGGDTVTGGIVTALGSGPANVTDGDKGDVSVSGGVWTIDNGVVANAKLADLATQRVKGRNTAGTGAPEDVTYAQFMDWVSASVAQGDILYRGSSGFERLAAGTARKWLETGGSGANPSWVGRHGCRVYHSVDQNISHATLTAVALNSERWDTNAFHDTSTNNSRITIPTGMAGIYMIGAGIHLTQSLAGSVRIIALRVNGTTYITEQNFMPGGSSGNCRTHIATCYEFAAGDYIEVMIYQDSSFTLAAYSNTTADTTNHYTPEFWCAYLGPKQ